MRILRVETAESTKKYGNPVFSGVSEPNISLAFFKETKEELSNALKYHLNTL